MVQRPSAALLARLKDLLGPAGTVESEADKAPYLTDWRRRYRGDTPLVLRPGTTAEVQAVVGLCAAAGVALVPQGGNTGLVGGGTPFEHGAELLLSLTRLNRIRAVDPIDDTLVAEAGVTLAGVQVQLPRSTGSIRCPWPPRAVAPSAAMSRPMPAASMSCAMA